MITGHCITNLDEFQKEEWPNYFVAVPRVGEVVRAKSGKQLKVVRIVHYQSYAPRFMGQKEVELNPCVEIELNK